jgi:outer membrane autotransporter protein
MMGVDQSVANEEMPYFNAWINAEGDMSELSESGTESGYKLTSWGGTVGFDVDFCPTFTAGMALTAIYGDLDADGADKATGNLDTQYLSIFARYAPSAWTHTFVGTIGMADISLDRTVAGVQTQGETDGLSFGLMYEVGRVYALDEDGSTCLQPVFNVTWKHTTVDAYTEKGGDVALSVDEQSLDTITFGLGARLQTVVGESMYNRTSIFECRLLAKADVGDRESPTDVTLAGAEAEVKSAEAGAFGLEAGAGLTIPLGDEGSSIFMDASVEIRADYTNVNGTVGYRINF